MFATSTHKRCWIFADKEVLDRIRKKCLDGYVQRFKGNRPDAELKFHFLTDDEEIKVQSFFERELKEFCAGFTPPMPRNVVETAIHYYKRFYLHHSVMDYHPKEIGYTCAYLACKIEEFNLSMSKFIMPNIPGKCEEKEKIEQIILDQEMLLMETLKFQFKVHSSFDAADTILNHIKANGVTLAVNFDVDDMTQHVERFLEYSLLTDVPLLFTTPQIALAAVLHGAFKLNRNGALDSYVSKIIAKENEADLRTITRCIKKIRTYVNRRMKEVEVTDLGYIELKLKPCRNEQNNPYSKKYKPHGEDSDEDL